MATILIIDDDDELLLMLGMIFRRAGYETIVSNDSTSALDDIREKRPDLIVLDLMMPYLNGFEVCRCVREMEHGADTPIMILSARMQPEDRDKAFAAGANDYVMKPVTSRELIERARRLLEPTD
ncbi:MAG: response regulator [Anaerolineae bacterium]|nr:response regulator [Anaerolineae bacterium]MCO5189421.1 response regulator [Anaerolineae bacterium]MCO5192574.1 response regulator [Anaerolineae bacterium]MCO5199961.1 response regulator [Anaerolineae bacterium]MCO5203626.1 response regulator [Anaerolineae bacterium]